MLGVMTFVPAIIVAPLVGLIPLHESYDLVIGVDGFRVANFVDFCERVRETRPGETVYLNILRNGLRLQVPVVIPTDIATPYCPSAAH